MVREIALARRILVLFVAVAALAGCGVLGVSTLPSTGPKAVPTAIATATAIPPTATATTEQVVAVVVPLPTDTPEPSATPAPTATLVPPTDTPAPTDTPVPPTATATKIPATSTPKPPTATPTKPPATATKAPTPRPTATKVPAPKGKVVGLDPGHDPTYDLGGYSIVGVPEYKLNMETAMAVGNILVSKGYTVRYSHTGTTPVAPLSVWLNPSLTYIQKVEAEQKARIAAVGVVDAYVPIHFNASTTHTIRGTESYYNLSTPVGARSRTLAQYLDSEVYSHIRRVYPTALNRGAKSDLDAGKSYGHMFSLSGPYPSAMIESLFMDQPDDAAALREQSVRNAIAQGIAQGIIDFLH